MPWIIYQCMYFCNVTGFFQLCIIFRKVIQTVLKFECIFIKVFCGYLLLVIFKWFHHEVNLRFLWSSMVFWFVVGWLFGFLQFNLFGYGFLKFENLFWSFLFGNYLFIAISNIMHFTSKKGGGEIECSNKVYQWE